MNNKQLIYDFSNSEEAKRKKKKHKPKFEKELTKYYLIFLIFLCLQIYFIIHCANQFYQNGFNYNYTPLLVGIFLAIIPILIVYFVSIDLIKRSYFSKTMDLKIFPTYLVIPEWNRVEAGKAINFPKNYIKKIYWNPNLDYFFIIPTEKGIKDLKLQREFQYISKKLIEDIDSYLNKLKLNNYEISNEELTWDECLKRYKNFYS